MKILFQSLIVALFVLVMSLPAQAITGNDLLNDCEKGEDQSTSNYDLFGTFCQAYITGVVDGLNYLDSKQRFCLLEGVTHGQGKKVVIKYLKENPQKLHEGYVSLILSALKEAFPCKETELNAK